MDLANLPERRYRIPYNPRPQFKEYHDRTERWALIVAHRRFGRTVGCVNDLIRSAVRCKLPEPRFAYVAPTYAQAKDVAWGYLKQFGLCIAGTVANESELHVTFPNGGRVRLYGSDSIPFALWLFVPYVLHCISCHNRLFSFCFLASLS